MLDKVKLALRITNKSFDNEIESLINACKKELELVGIASSKLADNDELITQAVINYCKGNFGFDNPEAERYLHSYELLKTFFATNNNYKEVK